MKDILEEHGECRLTNPSEGETRDRDPELGRRDIRVEVSEPIEHIDGALVAFGGKLLDAGAPDGDEGELGRDEVPICEDENDDGNET
jgi:hypothetical protein